MSHTELLRDITRGTDGLDFLWIELTNRCNLQCIHCYAESGPHAEVSKPIGTAERLRLISEAGQLGCRSIQFIGGEPTLDRDLPVLIERAAEADMDFVEVFTNLTRLPNDLVNVFVAHNVRVATSVYASDASVHDRVTTVTGSFVRTIGNIRKLLAAGITVRAGVIAMDANRGLVEETIAFLKGLGVENCGWDVLRHIGRGNAGNSPDMSELCGECAGGTLCIGADGAISPCIMSKTWSVGNVRCGALTDVIESSRLQAIRAEIAVKTQRFGAVEAICTPKTCGPYATCNPRGPSPPCEPSGCMPCYPKG